MTTTAVIRSINLYMCDINLSHHFTGLCEFRRDLRINRNFVTYDSRFVREVVPINIFIPLIY